MIAFGCACLAVGNALTSEFWDVKEPSEWTSEELEILLKDSPWAITKTVAQGAILGSRNPSARRRSIPRSSPKTITFTVRWLSADPVREAFGRFMASQGKRSGQRNKAQSLLKQAESHFIVMIADMPANIVQQTDTTEPKLQKGSVLKVKDRFEMAPSRVSMHRGGGEAQILFYFPRSEDVTVEDKEIEFQVKIGAATIKRRFKPAKMRVDGELAL
jgi:hypothetical protein